MQRKTSVCIAYGVFIELKSKKSNIMILILMVANNYIKADKE